MKPIRAVAFDIDGTLYPNSRMYMASFGFAMKNFKLLNQFREVRHELRSLRRIDDFHTTQAALLAKKTGMELEQSREIIQREFYTNWEAVLHRVNLFPGVIELLSTLKAKHIPMAVLSDFPVVSKLKVLKIENYFDVELSSEDVGYLKPAPESFQVLIDRLGLPAEEILFIGNSYEYDVKGSAALGMQTAHLTRRAPVGSTADFSFQKYEQLSSWLLPRLKTS